MGSRDNKTEAKYKQLTVKLLLKRHFVALGVLGKEAVISSVDRVATTLDFAVVFSTVYTDTAVVQEKRSSSSNVSMHRGNNLMKIAESDSVSSLMCIIGSVQLKEYKVCLVLS